MEINELVERNTKILKVVGALHECQKMIDTLKQRTNELELELANLTANEVSEVSEVSE